MNDDEMNDMQKLAILAELAVFFEVKPSQQKLIMFCKAIQHREVEDVRNAAHKWIQQGERFPLPKNLLELMPHQDNVQFIDGKYWLFDNGSKYYLPQPSPKQKKIADDKLRRNSIINPLPQSKQNILGRIN